jgi:hypothetical protein
VGYKGCWVEADEPNEDRVKKINDHLIKRRIVSINDAISESDEDDPDVAFTEELENEIE